MNKKLLNGILSFLVIATFIASACNKPKFVQAEIVVKDSTGENVQDARVIVYCVEKATAPRECDVADTQYTTETGKAIFENFENPAVLKVSVWKEDVITQDTGTFPNIGTIKIGDSLCAETFITLIENEIVEETVTLEICNSNSN